MARRRCQFCTAPLGRLAKLLHIYTCKNCVYRMSMGTSPSRPPADDVPVLLADIKRLKSQMADMLAIRDDVHEQTAAALKRARVELDARTLSDTRWKLLADSARLRGWSVLTPEEKAPGGTPARVSPKDCDRIVDAAVSRVREVMEMWAEDSRYHRCGECGRKGPLKHEGNRYTCAECQAGPGSGVSGTEEAL